MKLLILGSTSYLGKSLINRLDSEKMNFVTASRSSTSKNSNTHYNLLDNFNLSEIVIRNEISVVINCINSYYKNPNIEQVEEMQEINYRLPLKFIKEILLLNIDVTFLNFASYFNFINVPEESLEYQKSKKMLSKEIVDNKFNSNIKELIISDVFGEWDNRNKIFNIILKNLIKNKEIVFSNPNNYVNLIYIEKLIDYIFDFIKNKENLGTYLNEYSIQVKDLNTLLKTILNNDDCNLDEYFNYENRFEDKKKHYGNSILNDISKVLNNEEYKKFLVEN